MQAIGIEGSGKDAKLVLGPAPDPEVAAGQVLIDVVASAVNRADLLQRRGLYPPPAGASDVIGLECAGVIAELGPGVSGWSVGDRVMALLPGGGYAERAAVHAGSLMRVPERLSLVEAAAVPEVFLTCHLNLFMLGGLERGHSALVHGGGSGIGTAAIQMLGAAGVRSIVTAGSEEKCARCRELGADLALNYREGDFAPAVLEATDGRGVEAVLDSIGAPYLEQHLRCLAVGGRLVLIGLMGGAKVDLNLGVLLARRLSLIGSTLRTRPVDEKARIVADFLEHFGTALDKGEIGPQVDTVLPLAEAQAAQDRVEASAHFGKVVLQVRDE